MPLDVIGAAFSLSTSDTRHGPVPLAEMSQDLASHVLEPFLLQAMTRLRHRASRGHRFARTALPLASPDHETSAALIAAELEKIGQSQKGFGWSNGPFGPKGDLSNALSRFFYRLAMGEFGANQADRQIILLSSVLFEDELGLDPALGLAICAIRLGRLDEALALATESLRRGSKHPRAFCIAGLCELDRGELSAAQQYLAIATRVARSQPKFRNDMRMAQRLLLILNFGWRKAGRSISIKEGVNAHDA